LELPSFSSFSICDHDVVDLIMEPVPGISARFRLEIVRSNLRVLFLRLGHKQTLPITFQVHLFAACFLQLHPKSMFLDVVELE
jgi:hypothetical protein